MDWLFLSQGRTLGGTARPSYPTVLWPFLVANLVFLGFCQGNFHYVGESSYSLQGEGEREREKKANVAKMNC